MTDPATVNLVADMLAMLRQEDEEKISFAALRPDEKYPKGAFQASVRRVSGEYATAIDATAGAALRRVRECIRG